MNIRPNEINELFHFLYENNSDESNFDLILVKLEQEISKEQLQDSDRNRNEYLDGLLSLKEIGLERYYFIRDNRFEKDDDRGFKRFIGNFIHIVKLHGLGVAQ